MAMPPNPNSGNSLADILARSAQTIGEAYQTKRAQHTDENILNSIKPNSSPLELSRAHQRLSPGGQKQLTSYLQQGNQQAQFVFSQLENPNLSATQKLALYSQLPEEYKKYTSQAIASILGPQAQSQADLSQLQQFLGQNQGAQQNMQGAQSPAMDQSLPNQIQQGQSQPQQQVPQSFGNSIKDLSDEQIDVLSSVRGPLGKLAETERIKSSERLASGSIRRRGRI